MRIDSGAWMAKWFGLTIAGCSCVFGVSPVEASNCKISAFYVADTSGKPMRVTVTGKLTREFACGPPNFGEYPRSDSHWYPWFVQLDYPMRIRFQGAHQPRAVLRKIQVRGKFEWNGSYEQFRVRHVEVSGRLYEGTAPSDETRAVLEATQIAITYRARCPG